MIEPIVVLGIPPHLKRPKGYSGNINGPFFWGPVKDIGGRIDCHGIKDQLAGGTL
jgi:hypothetical protein